MDYVFFMADKQSIQESSDLGYEFHDMANCLGFSSSPGFGL